MPLSSSLASLLAVAAAEGEPERALELLTRGVLELTASRNTMLAVMNDELGCMELLFGAGTDWSEPRKREAIRIDLARSEGIVGFVAASGNSLMTGNVENEPHYRKLYETTRSEIAVPVKDRDGRVRAVLNAESDKLDAYAEADLEACEALASLVFLVLERSEQLRREEALVRMGNALDTAQTVAELLEQVISVAGEVLRFQACSIFLSEPSSPYVVLRASLGYLKEKVGQIRYAPGDGCTGWVAENGKPIRLAQPQSDPRWRGRFLEFPGDQIASFLAVPMLYRGNTTGVIRVIRRVSENVVLDNAFTESDERLLLAIGEQVASGIENIRAVEKMIVTERMAAWGELSAKSSHMIGNRVFALKGDVNELEHRLLKAPSPDDEIREIMDSLKANVQRIDEILQDFRDFLTATQLSREETDLNLLVKETLGEVFPKRTTLKLESNFDPELPRLALDSRRIRRAVAELVENALIWNDAGKLVVKTGRAAPELLDRAGLNGARQFAAIEVLDEGPGVPPDQKQEIFMPFKSGRVKGMGLGLSIVKGVAEAHGGTVIEIGQEGDGARFVILLPLPGRQNSEESS